MTIENLTPAIRFGTKAETLEYIRPHIKTAVVDPLHKFTVSDWRSNQERVLLDIRSAFPTGSIIVRSSALNEDSLQQSNAGHYTSIGNVSVENPIELLKAIDEVIASYHDTCPNHQIFLQSHLQSVELSGVIFTRDIDTLAPYITINYDDRTGRTDTITSGMDTPTKTLILFKEHCYNIADKRFQKLTATVQELEQLFRNDALDIEFAILEETIHILQVRPIVRRIDTKKMPDTKLIRTTLEKICARVKELSAPHPDLYGDETLYGIMPDWNPAEMIGVKPRPLALSLYRELITDSVWAYQRDNYGYKRLRSFPLLISLAGHPYIDVRVDFNSFIPKTLDDALSHKLANYYLQKLKNQPASHDKVEFDIILSCYTFDIDQKLQELEVNGFTAQETAAIKQALHAITEHIIGYKNEPGLYKGDLDRVRILEERRKALLGSSLTDVNKIYWLVEDCKRYGTLPFAGIARAGFVAMIILNSLVARDIFTIEDKQRFLNSIITIVQRLNQDTQRLREGTLSKTEFIERYGHLRPGTYDITLPNYEENFENYFRTDIHQKNEHSSKTQIDEEEIAAFVLTNVQATAIQKLLDEHRFSLTPGELMTFMREAIEGREFAKYAFTKSVSEILNLLKKFGAVMNLTTDDLSFTEIATFLRLYSTVAYFNEQDLLTKEIERNRNMYHLHQSLKLPHLICRPEDIFAFHLDTMEPNYITTQDAEGDALVLTSETNKTELVGKIVFITSADPGYDWIFSHSILGLITTYGGANSHMAIRAAELSIPAVIGCGPVLFERWSHAKRLRIDCASKRVIPLSQLS